jgi:hypothetical protein
MDPKRSRQIAHNKLTGKYNKQRDRTRLNKMRHIVAALETATGSHAGYLAERLNHWRSVRFVLLQMFDDLIPMRWLKRPAT